MLDYNKLKMKKNVTISSIIQILYIFKMIISNKILIFIKCLNSMGIIIK